MVRKRKNVKNASPRSVPIAAHVFIPLLVLPVLITAASLIPPDSARLWGLNFGAWLPSRFWLPVVGLPFLLLLPGVRRWITALPLLSAAERGSGKPTFPFVVLGLGALLLAAMLLWSVPYPFLGDGVFYRSEVFRLLNDPGHVSALIKPTSMLSGALIEAVAHYLKPEHTDTPYFVVCLIALVSGTGIAAYLLRGAKPLYQALLIAPLFLGSGVLLHFTYVELYMLQYSFCALYCLSLFTFHDGQHSVLLPVVLLLLAIAFGLSSVILLLSLLVLLLLKYRPVWLGGRRRRAALLAALLLGGVAAIALLHGMIPARVHRQFLMAFTLPGTDPAVDSLYYIYSVLSSAHLIDILNVLLLNCAVLLPVLLVQSVRRGLRTLLDDDVSFLLLVASVGGVLQLLFGASTFALARDWDLMLLPSLPIAYLSIRLILLEPAEGNRRLLAFGSVTVLATGTLLWLGINLSPASAQRYESILDADRAWVGVPALFDGYRTLEQYHGNYGSPDDAERIIVKMIDLGYRKLDSYELYFLNAIRMRGSARFMETVTWLMDTMARDESYRLPPDHWKHFSKEALHSKLASVIIEAWTVSGNEAIVAAALERYSSQLPDWKAASLLRALVATDRPPGERYAMVEDDGFTDETDAMLYPYRANLAQLAGLCDTAVFYFEAMIRRDIHAHPLAYLSLANVHLECRQDTAAAVDALLRLDENCKLATKERVHAQKMLRRLRAAP